MTTHDGRPIDLGQRRTTRNNLTNIRKTARQARDRERDYPMRA